MTSFDIEDNGIEISVENDQPRANKINKIKKNASSKKSKVAERNTCEELVDNKNVSGEGNAPGVGKVYVKTWGCAHNNSDSEYMAGLVSEYGYTLTDERSDADLWLLNSCTVKSPAEMHFRNFIDEGLKNNKSIVVSGCVAQSDPNSPYLKGISIVGVHQIDRVVEVVEETLKGHSVQLLGTKKENGKKKGGARLDLPKIRKNPLVEILAINTGCLNRCTYCKTKHARGDLGSYHPEELVERARVCFMDQGCKELWITSEDTGAYGLDIGSSLPELMWKLIDVTPVDCMIRLGMTNPPYMRRYLEDIAKLLNHKNVYSFLHIPVQSGSDGVLTDMKREYCSEDFCEIVDFLQERVPGLTIATDFICGFPTETGEDFQESLDLLEKYKFPTVFINQFFPRPGTPAAFMRQIPGHQIKKRTAAMSSLFKSYQPYKGREGRVYDILVTDVSFDKKHYIGHNKCYEQILIPMRPDLMGKWVKVKVIATSKFSMHAQIIEERISIWRSLMEKMYQLTSVNNNSMQFMCVLKTASYFCSISIPIFLMYRKGVLKL